MLFLVGFQFPEGFFQSSTLLCEGTEQSRTGSGRKQFSLPERTLLLACCDSPTSWSGFALLCHAQCIV